MEEIYMARVELLARTARIRRLAAAILGASFILGIILGIGGMSHAQSGRRVQKKSEPVRTSPSTQVEQPAEEPEPARPEPVTPKYSLVVASDTSNLNSSRNFLSYIVGNCVQRLKESPLLAVTIESSVNRKKASDRAKTESEKYVVFIEFEGDSFGGSGRLSDYYVNYTIFTPGTAKIKSQGRVYLRASRNVPTVGVGGVGIPVPVPLPPGTTIPGGSPGGARSPIEQTLEYAGRETGDKIMSAFDVAVAPGRRFPMSGLQ
jgi:hypothetical protein